MQELGFKALMHLLVVNPTGLEDMTSMEQGGQTNQVQSRHAQRREPGGAVS